MIAPTRYRRDPQPRAGPRGSGHITKRGISIRSVLESEKRRQRLHEQDRAAFAEVLEDQARQALSDQLLGLLVSMVENLMAPNAGQNRGDTR